MTRERLKGHALIFSANLIFGINYPISKWLLAERLTPEFHTLARMVFACVMFWTLSFFLPKEKLPPKALFVLFICSFCGVAGNQALFIYGLSMTSPIDASVITTGTPIFVMLLAAVILREPITWLKTAGVLLGAAGAACLVAQSNPHGGSGAAIASVPGDLCVLASCVVYAIYFVFSKPLSEKYSAVTMMKWMFLFASAEVSLFAVPTISDNGILLEGATFDGETFAAMAYVIGCATFLAYLLIPMAVRRIRPTTASMYNYVQPIVACALAAAIGQDSFSPGKLLATAAVFVGVYMVTKSKARRDMIAAGEA